MKWLTKNIPVLALCLVLFFGIGLLPASVQAQTLQQVAANEAAGVTSTSTATGTPTLQQVAAAESASSASSGCGISSLGNIGQCLLNAVGSAMLTIANTLLGVAGTLLNFVIVKTVFQFSSIIGNSPGLLTGWKILRDIGNMVLLFGFIFIGLSTILDLHTYTAQKALPRLIIFAVLINFSLFAAEAVIDISNVFSTVMYSQANTDPCFTQGTVTVAGTGTDSLSNLTGSCGIDYGIAGHIMESTGLSTIFAAGTPAVGISVFIGLSLFALIGAVVLFATAIMLAFRAISLTFLMVVAPLGFAGMALPPFQAAAQRWWSMLIHQAFFAPILLLLLFVSLKIADGFGSVGGQGLAAALSQPNVSTMGVFLVFTLVIGFMIASLMIAKSFGAAGAALAVNLGSKFAFGGFARTANIGVGGGSFVARRFLQRTAPNNPVSKFLSTRVLSPLEKTNLDFRRLPGAGRVLGAAGITVGAKPSEHATFSDVQHQYAAIRAGKGNEARNAEYDKQVAVDNLARELEAGSLSPESERFLAGLSADDIAANHDLQHSIDKLADRLSPDQFENMMKSDKIDQNTKSALSAARFKDAKDAIAGGYANKSVIQALSNKDIEMLAKYDASTFNTLISTNDPATGESMISGDQSEALAKSNALTNSQRAAVKQNTKGGRIEAAIAQGNSALAATYARTLSSKAKAKLGGGTLTNPEIMNTFTAADLADIQKEGKLTTNQIQTISNAVRSKPDIKNWLDNNINARSYWQ